MCFYLQVMWRNIKRLIAQLNQNRLMSLTHGGTWHHLIRRRFNQTSLNLKHSSYSYNGRDSMCVMDTWTHRDHLIKME